MCVKCCSSFSSSGSFKSVKFNTVHGEKATYSRELSQQSFRSICVHEPRCVVQPLAGSLGFIDGRQTEEASCTNTSYLWVENVSSPYHPVGDSVRLEWGAFPHASVARQAACRSDQLLALKLTTRQWGAEIRDRHTRPTADVTRPTRGSAWHVTQWQ